MGYLALPFRCDPRITLAHRYTAAPGFQLRDRVMPEFEIMLAVEGDWRIEFGQSVYVQHPGDWMILPPGVPHSQTLDVPDKRHIHYAAHFTADVDLRMLDERVFADRAAVLAAMEGAGGEDPQDLYLPVFSAPANRERVASLFADLVSCWRSPRLLGRKLSELRLLEILAEVGWDAIAGIGRTGARASRTAISVGRAIAYLRANMARPLRVSEIAGIVGLNPSYFGTVFRREVGATWTEYLGRMRVQRAKDLIRESGLGMARIAEAVGIGDPYYFSKLFRRFEGLSPTEYGARFPRGRPGSFPAANEDPCSVASGKNNQLTHEI